jgi:hypothetical protein
LSATVFTIMIVLINVTTTIFIYDNKIAQLENHFAHFHYYIPAEINQPLPFYVTNTYIISFNPNNIVLNNTNFYYQLIKKC